MTVNTILEKAREMGVIDPHLDCRSGTGWELRGDGVDTNGRSLVCVVARKLGIAWGGGGYAKTGYQQVRIET